MKQKIMRVLVLVAAMLLPLSASAAIYFGDTPPFDNWSMRPLMRLTVFASGQSDCMLLEANGQAMMIDGGSAPFRDPLRMAMEARGITSFKYLLNTHYHEDHIEGLYWLMRYGFTADEYLHPYSDTATLVERHVRTIAQAKRSGIPVTRIFDGDELLLGEAAIRIYRYTEIKNVNAQSLVAHITFGDSTILLTADIIGETQRYFAQNLLPEQLKADILKAPHHGITPMVDEFLSAVDPDVLLFTSTSKRVTTGAAQAVRSELIHYFVGDGTVILETDGTDWYVRQLVGEF
ncbi:MAG: MBL fold metallo-hydrolase [Clostridiales bacterium]|nr:MBL fold metallo-hydrolase [Clostridiales bacterium]